jgi:hypothetical protein
MVRTLSAAPYVVPPFPVMSYLKEAAASTFTKYGALVLWDSAGTLASDDDANGPWLKFTSGAVSGNVARGNAFTATNARPDWNAVCETSIRLIDVANTRIWIGFQGGDPSASATPAVRLAAFRFDTGAGDTHWQAQTSNGTGTQTITDTGITPNAGDRAKFEVRLNGATNVTFYINGALVATNAANLPAATSLLGMGMYITTLTAAGKAIAMAYQQLWTLGR